MTDLTKIKVPDLAVRLSTWENLIKSLHEKEVDDLDTVIDALNQSKEELPALESLLTRIEEETNVYEQSFISLVKRLRIPAYALREHILELSYSDFKVRAEKFREQEHISFQKRAESIADTYAKASYQMTDWDYFRKCESLVTGYIFRIPFFTCKDAREREIFAEVFEGWNPEFYAGVFRKKLKSLLCL